jgi:hypothetical protein
MEHRAPALVLVDMGMNETTSWRPIATAPTDGWALLWKPARYSDDEENQGYNVVVLDVSRECLAGWGYTHWMPLPEPPHAHE